MELVIKISKCILILTEAELLNNLPPGLLETAIKRGKYLKRCERVARYEKSRADFETEDIYGKRGDER